MNEKRELPQYTQEQTDCIIIDMLDDLVFFHPELKYSRVIPKIKDIIERKKLDTMQKT